MIGTQRLLWKVGNEGSGNGGFTIVELLIVLVLSVMVLGGILFLLQGSTEILKTNRNLLAITDSSRRALSTMARQLRGALHFENGECDEDVLTFYADVEGDEYFADVVFSENWKDAPKVEWSFDEELNAIFQKNTEGDVPGQPVRLASDVTGLKFEYFVVGSATPLASPESRDINGRVGRVRITVTMKKDKTTRTLSQDVFLRVMQRMPETGIIKISSVTPSRVPRTWGPGEVTIVGTNTNFIQGISVVTFDPPPSPYINLGATTVDSSTRIRVQVTVNSCPPQSFYVNVETGDEMPYSRPDGFTVVE